MCSGVSGAQVEHLHFSIDWSRTLHSFISSSWKMKYSQGHREQIEYIPSTRERIKISESVYQSVCHTSHEVGCAESMPEK